MEQIRRVIALGFFDGVHLGHGALLKRVAEVAAEKGLVPAAVTFDRHPGELLPGGKKTALLTTPAERERLMRELYGIREVMVLPFDAALRDMDWRDFVTGVLMGKYAAAHLVAGYDFHFGKGGAGDADRLRALCAELGLGCDIIPPVKLDGVVVSSTCIREMLERGETEKAERFSGHRLT